MWYNKHVIQVYNQRPLNDSYSSRLTGGELSQYVCPTFYFEDSFVPSVRKEKKNSYECLSSAAATAND